MRVGTSHAHHKKGPNEVRQKESPGGSPGAFLAEEKLSFATPPAGSGAYVRGHGPVGVINCHMPRDFFVRLHFECRRKTAARG